MGWTMLRRGQLRRLGLVVTLAAGAALAGCGGGSSGSPTSSSAALGSANSAAAAPSSGAGAGGATAGNLALSGSPVTAVAVGSAYAFRPTLAAPSGTTVGFSVQNLPAWASFSTVTGQLQGTPRPSDVGVYSNIVISASDGGSLASLQAFAITVQSSASANGSGTATLSWVAPTTNADGSPMTDLAGFRIYYGTSGSSLDNVVDVVADGNNAGFVVSGLAPGTYYFRVSALDSSGVESAESNEISRTVS